MKNIALSLAFFLLSVYAFSQAKPDTAFLSKIKKEAFDNSKSMEMLYTMTDSIGPHMMWSPEYKLAGAWAVARLKEFGLQNVHEESFDKIGKSWSIKKYYAHLVSPTYLSLTAYPNVFSISTSGEINSEVVYLEAKDETEFDKYKGQLKGKIVLIADTRQLYPYKELFNRYADSTLTKLAGEKIPTAEEKEKMKKEQEETDAWYQKFFGLMATKVAFCKKEGAALLLEPSFRYYGIVQVWGAISPVLPKDGVDYLAAFPADPTKEDGLPMLTISTEQYNYIIRLIKSGKPVKMQADVETLFNKPGQGFNVIGEIPGTDKKDEVVIIGGHLDCYPAGLGAADNDAGVVTCMEAMRILQKLGLKPHRTIRIGLWGAEEQGLIGSEAHIKQHFVAGGKEKCYAYFNMDNGAGRFRGVWAEENEGARNLFLEWMVYFNDPKFKTVCISSTENTDHVSFVKAGLPGFQFIQDNLDYFKIYHTNMDTPERIPKEDMKYNAYLMAAFAYFASINIGDFPIMPRKN